MLNFIISLFTRYSVVEEWSYWSEEGVRGYITPISRHLTERGALRSIRNFDDRFFAEYGCYYDEDRHTDRFVVKGAASRTEFGWD